MTMSALPRPTRSRHALRPRAGALARSLFLGGLILATATALVGGQPAQAQTVANPNDQPTPATLPSRDRAKAADRASGQVSPPRAIRSSTSVVASDARKSTYTNPLDQLPARDRAGTGGRGE